MHATSNDRAEKKAKVLSHYSVIKKTFPTDMGLKSLASHLGKSNSDWYLSLNTCVAKIQ